MRGVRGVEGEGRRRRKFEGGDVLDKGGKGGSRGREHLL